MPKHIKLSVIASNAAFPVSFVALLVWLVVSPQAIAQEVPDDVLELRPGGYAFADYPGVFDAIDGEGITLEAWIYLTDLPKDRAHSTAGQWVIIAKPGSYEVTSNGRDLSPGIDQGRPEGTVWVWFGISEQPRPDGRAMSSFAREFPPGDFPLERWVHIALQIVAEKFETRWISFFDRQRLQDQRQREAMGRTAAPLLIGGSKQVTFFKEGLFQWGEGYESMEGFIDEVRVSKGFRYPQGVAIIPRREFRADARTIALWHFDDGPGALSYADASGNGYTLFAGGSLAVDARGKLATTWGSLKSRNWDTNP